MQDSSAANVVFHEQNSSWPVVAGVVVSHASYCERVTSVASIE
jgi:hypothetical protein